jgi:hypothetical protein
MRNNLSGLESRLQNRESLNYRGIWTIRDY